MLPKRKMTAFPPDYATIENDIIKHQLTSGLRNTIDQKFRCLFDEAKADWERNFAGNDPSDACVSVRISAGESSARSGRDARFFLPRNSSRSHAAGNHLAA